MRVQQQAAFVLHQRNYSETSLLLELFTRDHGRVGVLAKGARRNTRRRPPSPQPFQFLNVAWSGKGELPVLTAAEPEEGLIVLQGEAMYCGFYLNELLMRLLQRYDPHEDLFQAYRSTLLVLQSADASEVILRLFEKRLLSELGYGLVLDHDIGDNSHIHPEGEYVYLPEAGPVALSTHDPNPIPGGVPIKGVSLLALAHEQHEQLGEPSVLQECKRLMRAVLALYLGDKPLHSRKLFRPKPAASGNPTNKRMEP